jgi:hypothetical protein
MRLYHALPLTLLLLAGCGGGPSLVGKWNMTGAGVPQGATVVTEFTSNTFKSVVDMAGPGMSIHAESSGTYTFDGKKIKMTTTDIKLDDAKLPAMVKDLVKQQIDKEKGKSQEGELKIEGDKATISTPEGVITLTKVGSAAANTSTVGAPTK